MNKEGPPKQTHLSKSALVTEFWNGRKKFFGYIRRYIYDREEEQDIFQHACLKFLAAEALFDHPRVAESYFYHTLRTLSIDHIRKARRLIFPETLPDIPYNPQPDWDRRILMERVYKVSEQLSPKDRQVLEIYLDPDLRRLKDKCKAMNRSPGTVRYHIKKLVNHLRKNLQEKSQKEGTTSKVRATEGLSRS
ncbi:sigma-70 family RNA polymerase sigma factor [Acidobacteria bacterium AH-259-G07]|nr:sigma-70 family RNA polymerase sigma factor [Acidobacteria bacterium AH-259-G07]